MFVAVLVPEAAAEHLAEFLAPRQEAGRDLRWTVPEQWHVTLAFLPAVADRVLDELEERLARAAARRTTSTVRLAGAGAFPDPARAKVLWSGVEELDAPGEMQRLATGARAAAVSGGTAVEGGDFRPHVTLARTGPPVEATRWLRVLDGYRGPAWQADEVALVASHLGEGPRRRPRYEEVARFALGPPSGRLETRG